MIQFVAPDLAFRMSGQCEACYCELSSRSGTKGVLMAGGLAKASSSPDPSSQD